MCSVDGCDRLGKTIRGFCLAHYKRWWRHGDPQGGTTPTGAPAKFLNDVVASFDGDDCLIWPFGRNNQGYGQVQIDGRRLLVSRVVCEIANGPPPTPKHEAAHSCGKGHLGCITKRHLSWKTHVENQADQLVHGTRARGERHGSAKLRVSDVIEIRSLNGVVSQEEIARRFGVARATIGDILSGTTWGHLGLGRADEEQPAARGAM